MVYFITDGDYVKISDTGRGPKLKLKRTINRINAFNPRKINLIALVKGDKKQAKRLQHIFKRQHVYGDWYELSVKEIFSTIEKYNFELQQP